MRPLRRERMLLIRLINKASGYPKPGSLREEGQDPHASVSHGSEEYSTTVTTHTVKASNRNRIKGGPVASGARSSWRGSVRPRGSYPTSDLVNAVLKNEESAPHSPIAYAESLTQSFRSFSWVHRAAGRPPCAPSSCASRSLAGPWSREPRC